MESEETASARTVAERDGGDGHDKLFEKGRRGVGANMRGLVYFSNRAKRQRQRA